MPQGCRVFLLQQAKRRGKLRALLSNCGYGITPADGREVAIRFFMNGPCVMLVDPRAANKRQIDDAVRLARIAGVPIIAVGEHLGEAIRGVHHTLSEGCDEIALMATVELACYGHDHRGEDASAGVPAKAHVGNA